MSAYYALTNRIANSDESLVDESAGSAAGFADAFVYAHYSELRVPSKSLGTPPFLKIGHSTPQKYRSNQYYPTTNASRELQLVPIEMKCLFPSTITNWSRSATN